MIVFDEVSGWTPGANFVNDSVSGETDTSLLSDVVGRIFSTNIDTVFGSVIEDCSEGTLSTVAIVHGQAGIANADSLAVS